MSWPWHRRTLILARQSYDAAYAQNAEHGTQSAAKSWNGMNSVLPDARSGYVTYYLLDKGRADVEADIGYRPGISGRLRAVIRSHSCFTYFGGIIALTALLLILLGYLAWGTASWTLVVLCWRQPYRPVSSPWGWSIAWSPGSYPHGYCLSLISRMVSRPSAPHLWSCRHCCLGRRA